MREQGEELDKKREKITFDEAYQQLQGILIVLSESGFNVPEFCYTEETVKEDWEKKYDFPIARDGLDGIRVTRTLDGGFRVWFTNGFERPDNPRRREITEKLRAKGFDVV